MSTARKRTHRTDADQIKNIKVSDLRPSRENDKVYKPVDLEATATIDLANSILEHGVLEPLVVTADGHLVSGHRRLAAAGLAKVKSVPCRVIGVNRADLSTDEFLKLLTEHNRQRAKTLAEKAREAVIAVDPEDAYRALLQDRREKSDISGFSGSSVRMGAVRSRSSISEAKQPMLEAIQRILADYDEYLPISERKVHYELLNNPPLRHASKPSSTYQNNLNCYKDLSDLVTRARLAGDIPMDAIADDTRPVVLSSADDCVGDFMSNQFYWFLRGYKRNLLQSQSVHVELLVEKLALLPIVKPVAEEYGTPLTIGRGYASLPPRAQMAARFEQSGHDRLVLLVASDCDPDGVVIAESFARSMRDDFDIPSIVAIRVALTPDQAAEFEIPTSLTAKKRSSNYTNYVEQYGNRVWELEALKPKDLQRLVREGIESTLDMDAFQAEHDQYKRDAAFLVERREIAIAAMRDAAASEEEE